MAATTLPLAPNFHNATGAVLRGTAAWTTGNAGIATVDAVTGIVTAVGVGTTNITATANGQSGSCAVTVAAKPAGEGTYLANNLVGGDATVMALYSTLANVTNAAGIATAWDDVRGVNYNSGSGATPQLVNATTANRPLWDGGLFTVTADTTAKCLGSASSAFWALKGVARTVFFVGSCPVQASGTTYLGGICDSGSVLRAMICYQTATATGVVGINYNTLLKASVVNPSANLRLIVLSYDGATGVGVYIAGEAIYRYTVKPQPAGNSTLNLGGFFLNQNTAPAGAVYRAAGLLNRAATPNDLAVLTNWASIYHAIVLA